jgi:putative zinc finger/helix-turn-helix YgiT family protein
MRCPTCKKTNTLRDWEGPITRMGIEIVARGRRCSSCGEQLFDYEELGRQDALAADAIVARGIRTGKEFVFVRKSADLKAVEVAELFGVRPETVWRWEHGESEIPRTAAYALGQLYRHPKLTRQQLDAFATPVDTGKTTASTAG